MAIHQEELAATCLSPKKRKCTHKGEFRTFTASCHPTIRDDRTKTEVNNLAVKAIYSLETKELMIKCLICDNLVTTFAIAQRGLANGATGRSEPAPPSPAPVPKRKSGPQPSVPVESPQRMDRKAKRNRTRRR